MEKYEPYEPSDIMPSETNPTHTQSLVPVLVRGACEAVQNYTGEVRVSLLDLAHHLCE